MIRPCPCGSTPKLTEREQYAIQIVRLECQCGNHGATVYYTKPDQRAMTMRSVIDGWNLSQH